MSPRPLGISSGSLPGEPAGSLAETVRRLGGDTVDLRWGKGHAWEEAGLAPFDSAGVTIAFIGLGVALGAGDPGADDLAPLARLLVGRPPVPVKVFAAAALDQPGPAGAASRSLALRQADALTRAAGTRPLVETHHGYASLASLGALCRDGGCDLLLDVYGLHQLTGALDDEDGIIARFGRAAQVKGFVPEPGGAHQPLARLPEQGWTLVDALPAAAPVTIESRAGTLAEDLMVLRRRYSSEDGTR
jgi:hypothetical protein